MRVEIACIVGTVLLAAPCAQAAPAPVGNRPLLESANVRNVQLPRSKCACHYTQVWRSPLFWQLRHQWRGGEAPEHAW
jgi:hypothetical protein